MTAGFVGRPGAPIDAIDGIGRSEIHRRDRVEHEPSAVRARPGMNTTSRLVRSRGWRLRHGVIVPVRSGRMTAWGGAGALSDDLDCAFHSELGVFAAVLGAHDAREDVRPGSLRDAFLLVGAG